MSDCCSDQNSKSKEKKEEAEAENMSKSFIGRYLYKIGKEGSKKGKQKKGDCC